MYRSVVSWRLGMPRRRGARSTAPRRLLPKAMDMVKTTKFEDDRELERVIQAVLYLREATASKTVSLEKVKEHAGVLFRVLSDYTASECSKRTEMFFAFGGFQALLGTLALLAKLIDKENPEENNRTTAQAEAHLALIRSIASTILQTIRESSFNSQHSIGGSIVEKMSILEGMYYWLRQPQMYMHAISAMEEILSALLKVADITKIPNFLTMLRHLPIMGFANFTHLLALLVYEPDHSDMSKPMSGAALLVQTDQSRRKPSPMHRNHALLLAFPPLLNRLVALANVPDRNALESPRSYTTNFILHALGIASLLPPSFDPESILEGAGFEDVQIDALGNSLSSPLLAHPIDTLFPNSRLLRDPRQGGWTSLPAVCENSPWSLGSGASVQQLPCPSFQRSSERKTTCFLSNSFFHSSGSENNADRQARQQHLNDLASVISSAWEGVGGATPHQKPRKKPEAVTQQEWEAIVGVPDASPLRPQVYSGHHAPSPPSSIVHIASSKAVAEFDMDVAPPSLRSHGKYDKIAVFARPLLRTGANGQRYAVPLADIPPSLAKRVAKHAHEALKAAISVDEWVSYAPGPSDMTPRTQRSAPVATNSKAIFTEEDVARSQVRNSGHTRTVRVSHEGRESGGKSEDQDASEASGRRWTFASDIPDPEQVNQPAPTCVGSEVARTRMNQNVWTLPHMVAATHNRVELFFSLVGFIGGRRRSEVQDALFQRGILKILQHQIAITDWDHPKPDSPPSEHIHGPHCECNPQTAPLIQILRLVIALLDRDGNTASQRWMTRYRFFSAVEQRRITSPQEMKDLRRFRDRNLPQVLRDRESSLGGGNDDAGATGLFYGLGPAAPLSGDEAEQQRYDEKAQELATLLRRGEGDTSEEWQWGIVRRVCDLLMQAQQKSPFRYLFNSIVETSLRMAPLSARLFVMYTGIVPNVLEYIAQQQRLKNGVPGVAPLEPPKAKDKDKDKNTEFKASESEATGPGATMEEEEEKKQEADISSLSIGYGYQTSFDLLGEVFKYSIEGINYLTHHVKAELFKEITQATCRSLVDSNVFVRNLIITITHFKVRTGQVADFVRTHHIGMLYAMMKAIAGPRGINQENICCLNSSLLILVTAYRSSPETLAHTLKELREYELDPMRFPLPGCDRDMKVWNSLEPAPAAVVPENVKSGEMSVLLNFRSLLSFWRLYYDSRARDRRTLELSCGLPFHAWSDIVNILRGDGPLSLSSTVKATAVAESKQ